MYRKYLNALHKNTLEYNEYKTTMTKDIKTRFSSACLRYLVFMSNLITGVKQKLFAFTMYIQLQNCNLVLYHYDM